MFKIYRAILIIIALSCFSCELKSKTGLYLERGLDILSNRKQVDFSFNEEIVVEEIGVIRDKKENKKTLVFKLQEDVTAGDLAGYVLGVRAVIRGKGNKKRVEEWDFKPVITEVKNTRYLVKDIHVKEDKIQEFTVYLYRVGDGEKHVQGNVLTVNNLYTYND